MPNLRCCILADDMAKVLSQIHWPVSKANKKTAYPAVFFKYLLPSFFDPFAW